MGEVGWWVFIWVDGHWRQEEKFEIWNWILHFFPRSSILNLSWGFFEGHDNQLDKNDQRGPFWRRRRRHFCKWSFRSFGANFISSYSFRTIAQRRSWGNLMPLQVLSCCLIQAAIAYEVTSKVPLQCNNLHKSSYATAIAEKIFFKFWRKYCLSPWSWHLCLCLFLFFLFFLFWRQNYTG